MKSWRLVFSFICLISLVSLVKGENDKSGKRQSRIKAMVPKVEQNGNYQSGRQWWLAQLEGKPYNHKKNKRRPFIQFNLIDSTAFGFNGCNSFYAPLIFDSLGNVSFGTATNTLIACMDPNPEALFMKALTQTKRIVVNSNELKLVTSEGSKLLMFKLSNQP